MGRLTTTTLASAWLKDINPTQNEGQFQWWFCSWLRERLGMIVLGVEIIVIHGRIDVLAWHNSEAHPSFHVFELKTHALKMKDIGQILKYRHDITRMVSQSKEYFVSAYASNEYHDRYQSLVEGVQVHLVGRDCSEDVLAACMAADIGVFCYQYVDDVLVVCQKEPTRDGFWDAKGTTLGWVDTLHALFDKVARSDVVLAI